MRSKYDADGFLTQILPRMQGYVQQSLPIHPQLRPAERLMEEQGEDRIEIYRAVAQYLSTINLSTTDQWKYALKTLPRPKGAATRVIYTEYDLPREEMAPHDVIVDKDGIVWFSGFGEQKLGRLDPKTGKVTEFPYPKHRDNSPTGSLGLRADGAGNLWLGNMYQATIVKFDPKTAQFQFWTLPPEANIDAAQINMVSPQHSDVDGKVWTQNNGFAGVHRLDIATGKIETWEPFKGAPQGRAPQHLRRHPGLPEQRLLHRFPPGPDRPHRRQDRRGLAVPDADAALGAAARQHGRAGSPLVRRIPRRPDRDVRHEKPRRSRNGNSTRAGRRPMTSCSTRTSMRGPGRW